MECRRRYTCLFLCVFVCAWPDLSLFECSQQSVECRNSEISFCGGTNVCRVLKVILVIYMSTTITITILVSFHRSLFHLPTLESSVASPPSSCRVSEDAMPLTSAPSVSFEFKDAFSLNRRSLCVFVLNDLNIMLTEVGRRGTATHFASNCLALKIGLTNIGLRTQTETEAMVNLCFRFYTVCAPDIRNNGVDVLFLVK